MLSLSSPALQHYLDRSLPYAVGALLLLLGCLIGSLWQVLRVSATAPIAVIADLNTSVPVVSIEGIRDGAVRGSVTGEVRLQLDGAAITPAADGSFAVTSPVLTREIRTVQVPEGMQFVASKRGKKYYTVGSPAGERLSPANRIYFKDAESAEKAGYKK